MAVTLAEMELLDVEAAVQRLAGEEPGVRAGVLGEMRPAAAVRVLERMSEAERGAVMASAQPGKAEQWRVNLTYESGTLGRMMELPVAVFQPGVTVREAVEQLRELVKRAFITYAYLVDRDGKLLGVIVMRELLLAGPEDTLERIALLNPFYLKPTMQRMDAMRAVLDKHYPVYPVCDDAGRLVGLVRGSMMFEQQAIELTAQAGSMVGVERDERLTTPWTRSFRMRHPWLQLNLLTAFVAAAVVGVFEDTINRIVVLAVFLPVLAGQSGNTGCQALAVTLRGMTLGDLKPGGERAAMMKEAKLGLFNGIFVGLTAGLGMLVYALMQQRDDAVQLGLVVMLAMTGACIVSGISGVIVPTVLRRVGADPATASSIFLTTATDVASMGLFLGLATVMV